MKKSIFVLAFFILFAGLLNAQQLALNDLIKSAAQSVEKALPQGTKMAILNFTSPSETFSDYIIDELTGALVAGQKITVVDRRNLALISQEMKLQLSGDVSDESAQAIGRMLGAQSIVSGNMTNMGTFYQIRFRAINVETAAIQTQVSLALKNDSQVAFLLSGTPASTTQTTGGGNKSGTAVGTATGTSTYDVITPLTEGTMVPGNNLAEKLKWLDRNADSHNTYIVVVNANETIAPYEFNYSGAINITVALRGDNQNRTIRLRTNGTMFTVRENVTLILENNVTLMGHNGNTGSIISVNSGTFKMNSGAAIVGNYRNGIYMGSGTVEMKGGKISDNGNFNDLHGGGVDIYSGTFNLIGGTISDNKASYGGGIKVYSATLNMTGGIISGNTASKEGGGVYLNGTFIMRGGTITGNSAKEYGGGVRVSGSFTKTGGIITGYNTDQANGNVVKDETGTLARKGHAVFRNDNQRKETTAGASLNLSSNDSGRWD